jgi:23S rRNA G2069 N7-methylase RlmK/C1962 C5-methylase RlmI
MAEEYFRSTRLEKVPYRLIRGDAFEIMRGLEPGYDIVILDSVCKKRKGIRKSQRMRFRLYEHAVFECPSEMRRRPGYGDQGIPVFDIG